jgi:hypothetical protein
MSQKIREYAITYAVKNFLLSKNWDVIAYNPPGSQGTFTIPNPSKDGGYRGQTGSESPDIIAIKNGIVMIVECKTTFNLDDSKKLNSLSTDGKKMEILEMLISRVCKANAINVPDKIDYIFALAYQGTPQKSSFLGLINVKVNMDFDITNIKAISSYEKYFSATLQPASSWDQSILKLLKD